MPYDVAVPDGEVQGESGVIRASGGARGLPDLAEHHRVVAVDQHPFDPGVRPLGYVVRGQVAVVGGGSGAAGAAGDPGGVPAVVLVPRPVQPPVGVLGVQLGDPPEKFRHDGTGVGHRRDLPRVFGRTGCVHDCARVVRYVRLPVR